MKRVFILEINNFKFTLNDSMKMHPIQLQIVSKRISITLLLAAVLFSCSKSDPPLPVLNSAKELYEFELKKSDGSAFNPSDISIQIQNQIIRVIVPFNTNRNGLIPYFKIKGKTVSPASGIAQDFTNPVVYTVTAEDGSSQPYNVGVELAPAPRPKGIVYFGSSDNNFYAVNTSTGFLEWKYTGTNSFAYSSPVYNNGVIYIGSIDNNVYAFNAKTGVVIWKKTIATTGIESDAVYSNGTIYVGTNDDRLFALDAATGNEKWNFLTGSNISSSPVIENNTVYFGSSDGRLYALDANSGHLKWFYQTGGMINQSGAAFANNILYFGSRDGAVHAVNAATGTQVWTYYSQGSISLEMSSPAIYQNTVYIGGWYNISLGTKGSLLALNASTGSLVWEKLNSTGFASSPFVNNNIVLITGDDLKLHCLNAATGVTLWNKQVIANGASALMYENAVFVGGGGERAFYALDITTGNQIWKFNVPDGLMTSNPLFVSESNEPIYPTDSGMRQ